jgi:hypothetical protein
MEVNRTSETDWWGSDTGLVGRYQDGDYYKHYFFAYVTERISGNGGIDQAIDAVVGKKTLKPNREHELKLKDGHMLTVGWSDFGKTNRKHFEIWLQNDNLIGDLRTLNANRPLESIFHTIKPDQQRTVYGVSSDAPKLFLTNLGDSRVGVLVQ